MTGIVNGESVPFTKLSRSLEMRPLRAFIITSICSFIACISAKIGGGVVSITALWPFRSPSFGAVPLVFLLDVVSCVPLT